MDRRAARLFDRFERANHALLSIRNPTFRAGGSLFGGPPGITVDRYEDVVVFSGRRRSRAGGDRLVVVTASVKLSENAVLFQSRVFPVAGWTGLAPEIFTNRVEEVPAVRIPRVVLSGESFVRLYAGHASSDDPAAFTMKYATSRGVQTLTGRLCDDDAVELTDSVRRFEVEYHDTGRTELVEEPP